MWFASVHSPWCFCLTWDSNVHLGRYSAFKSYQSRILLYFPYFFFFLFIAAPAAHGSSWSRGQIRTAVEDNTTATATGDLSCICDLSFSLRQCWLHNPVSEAKDRTHILHRILTHWATIGTPSLPLLKNLIFFGCIRRKWKFPGQKSNLRHSCGNTRSSTHCATWKLLK